MDTSLRLPNPKVTTYQQLLHQYLADIVPSEATVLAVKVCAAITEPAKVWGRFYVKNLIRKDHYSTSYGCCLNRSKEKKWFITSINR